MKLPGRTILLLLACTSAISAPGVSASANYPDRLIEVVVPFAPGGGLDQNARNFAQALALVLKQPVAVSNKAGATGTLGLQAVAQAAPDGYTIVFTPAVPLSSGPHRLKSVSYNLASFEYVCQVFDNIFAIAVTKDSPYQTMDDLLADARKHPGKISYGSSGIGSIPHLGTSNLENASTVELNHVPYKGDGLMLQDLLGQRLAFGAVLASSITGQIQAGELRLLAVYSDKRHPAFPQVPTLTEAGIPVVQLSFGGVLVPAGTPANIVAKLESACRQAVDSPPYRDWAQRANQVVDYQPGAMFKQRMQQDSAQQFTTLRRLGLEAE